MRASIDQLVEKLERQVTRYKTQGRSRRRRAARANGPSPETMPVVADEDEPLIVKTKQFAVGPMSPSDAVLQLELIGHDFFVFRNDESNEINVVYRRRDDELRPDRAAVIFRREPLHKKLAREAQLEQTEPAAFVDPGPHWGNTGIHGVPRPRRWDAVASAGAPRGSPATNCTSSRCPTATSWSRRTSRPTRSAPLADAIEQTIQPPYRAEAVRQGDDVWAVAARRIEVAEFEADGEEIELVVERGRASRSPWTARGRSARFPSSSASARAKATRTSSAPDAWTATSGK